uniref:Uncharacterized protein n=1 Tax=Sciurus vulgaris TaxID=55149 RepID=A0A8D2AQR6_SCIVU
MSRRRKYGDSSAPKNTPRTTASEECSSVVEPGSRRLRSARRSVLRVAGEGPPGPTWQQEQSPAVNSGINSNPEERKHQDICGK